MKLMAFALLPCAVFGGGGMLIGVSLIDTDGGHGSFAPVSTTAEGLMIGGWVLGFLLTLMFFWLGRRARRAEEQGPSRLEQLSQALREATDASRKALGTAESVFQELREEMDSQTAELKRLETDTAASRDEAERWRRTAAVTREQAEAVVDGLGETVVRRTDRTTWVATAVAVIASVIVAMFAEYLVIKPR
ncbi:hypothetical protein [Streptacidiphilus pinicola]|nr:hypothetical protein [Streptacidiphilus pinicola]